MDREKNENRWPSQEEKEGSPTELSIDQYIMYTQSMNGTRRNYVQDFDKQKGFTMNPNPAYAQRYTRKQCRYMDQFTDMFLYQEPWTPGLQESLEESYRPIRQDIHYADQLMSLDTDYIRTACRNKVHRDSVTDKFSEVTCHNCIRKTHNREPSGRDIPKGYWPIKGKYFGQDIRTLPARYWCWVIDKTDMVHEKSYLYEFFKKHEATFRRRAGQRRKAK